MDTTEKTEGLYCMVRGAAYWAAHRHIRTDPGPLCLRMGGGRCLRRVVARERGIRLEGHVGWAGSAQPLTEPIHQDDVSFDVLDAGG
jgi:hypothetical protein